MTHAVVQHRKSGETNWSDPTKIHFSAEGSAQLHSRNDVTLGDLTVVLTHSLRPHTVKVIQAVPSEVTLRTDDTPLATLHPDGGTRTLFEYVDKTGTEWHVYHASEGRLPRSSRR